MMAEMMEATMTLKAVFARESGIPEALPTEILFHDIDVLLMPESSPSEDYTEDDLKRILLECPARQDRFNLFVKNWWVLQRLEVVDYEVIGHGDF